MNLPKPADTESKPPSPSIHVGGDVKADRGGIVNIQQNILTTPEQLDALLKKRLKEVMAELPTAEAERRAVLLKELDGYQGQV